MTTLASAPGDVASAVKQLPRRPRLAEYVVALPLSHDGVQLRAPGRAIVIRGRRTSQMFDAIRPLLNGSRSIEDVQANVVAVDPSAVSRLLSVLNDQGFLKDGPPDDDESSEAAKERRLFGRWLDVHGGTKTVADTIGARRVVVVGDGAASRSAVAVFAACQIDVDACLPEALSDVGLVVFAAPPFALEEALRLNRLSLAAGFLYLPLTFDGTCGLVGPVVGGRHGPCLHCLLLRQEANALRRREERQFREWRSKGEGAMAAWLPGAAQTLGYWGAELALRRLAGIDSADAPDARIYRVDFLKPAMSSHSLRRVPSCPACDVAGRRG